MRIKTRRCRLANRKPRHSVKLTIFVHNNKRHRKRERGRHRERDREGGEKRGKRRRFEGRKPQNRKHPPPRTAYNGPIISLPFAVPSFWHLVSARRLSSTLHFVVAPRATAFSRNMHLKYRHVQSRLVTHSMVFLTAYKRGNSDWPREAWENTKRDWRDRTRWELQILFVWNLILHYQKNYHHFIPCDFLVRFLIYSKTISWIALAIFGSH